MHNGKVMRIRHTPLVCTPNDVCHHVIHGSWEKREFLYDARWNLSLVLDFFLEAGHFGHLIRPVNFVLIVFEIKESFACTWVKNETMCNKCHLLSSNKSSYCTRWKSVDSPQTTSPPPHRGLIWVPIFRVGSLGGAQWLTHSFGVSGGSWTPSAT